MYVVRFVGVALVKSIAHHDATRFVCTAASFNQYIAFWSSVATARAIVVPVGIKSSIDIPFP